MSRRTKPPNVIPVASVKDIENPFQIAAIKNSPAENPALILDASQDTAKLIPSHTFLRAKRISRKPPSKLVPLTEPEFVAATSPVPVPAPQREPNRKKAAPLSLNLYTGPAQKTTDPVTSDSYHAMLCQVSQVAQPRMGKTLMQKLGVEMPVSSRGWYTGNPVALPSPISSKPFAKVKGALSCKQVGSANPGAQAVRSHGKYRVLRTSSGKYR